MTTLQETSATFTGYFEAFEHRFPTVESRHVFASELAVSDPTGLTEKEQEYSSRFVLAAHWGEDRPELWQIAEYLYGLKNRVDKDMIGQPAAVIKRGSLTDIWSQDYEESAGKLEENVELQYGFVISDELAQGFSGNATDHGPKRLGVKPPFVAFGTRIPMRSSVTVKVDVLGDVEITPSKDKDKDQVPVYFGVAPLKFGREVYHEGRQTRRREALLGGEAVSLLVQLAQKTRSDESLHALSELALSA